VAENDRQILIIGGGIAGITAALELARLGWRVEVIEKTPFLGGNVAHLCCQATTNCQKCGACLVEDRLRALFQQPGIRLRLASELLQSQRVNGGFQLTIQEQPRYIDPDRCIDCNLCYEQCPAAPEGAIVRAASPHNHPRYAINPALCLYFQDGSCRKCQELCPTQAIDLAREGRTVTNLAAAVVIASGFAPYNPRENELWHYGVLPNVITSLELEAMLRDQCQPRRADGQPANRIAFIQCVGSRNQTHPYCSRICCGYALRLAEVIKYRRPDSEITVFYMDIQNFGQDFSEMYEKCKLDLNLLRTLPGDIFANPEGLLQVRYANENHWQAEPQEFDLLVLSVGITPGAGNPALAAQLDLELDSNGFFQPADPLDRTTTTQPGIYLAGTAEGPKSIAESIAQATRAALKVDQYLQEQG
jgi:heterodisulfide reductase subunit A